MGQHVFISYSNHDKSVADAVCAALENRKVRCWVAPRDVMPGVSYADALIDGLNQSHLLILVFSSNSNTSSQVMREVRKSSKQEHPNHYISDRGRSAIKSNGVFPERPSMVGWLDTTHYRAYPKTCGHGCDADDYRNRKTNDGNTKFFCLRT